MDNNIMKLPPIGFGTYSLHGDKCSDAIYNALKMGYRLIDTASLYANEEATGCGVRRAVADGVCRREDVMVSTKLYPGEQYADPVPAIELALSKLDVGYIDIMLLHHPGANDIKAYKAMERYLAEGKIKALGISCFYIKELADFLPKVGVKPLLVQNEIHPYYQDTEVVAFIHSKGIAVQSWYPLGGRGFQAELMKEPVLLRIAETHRRSVTQVMLRWHYQRGVVAIPGSGNADHIAENISIFDFSLSDDEMAAIATLNRNEKHDWY